MLHGGGRESGAHGLGDALFECGYEKKTKQKQKKTSDTCWLSRRRTLEMIVCVNVNIIMRRVFSAHCRLLFSKSWPFFEASFQHKL